MSSPAIGFENPNVVFAIDRQGPLGDEYLEGNIGVDFLKPFRLVLDFPNKRAAFLPRVALTREDSSWIAGVDLPGCGRAPCSPAVATRISRSDPG